MARPVLGIAVEGQAREDEAGPRRQRGDDRLPLAVRQPQRVEQDERRAGPGLAVGDPGPVLVVVEPEPHADGSSHPFVRCWARWCTPGALSGYRVRVRQGARPGFWTSASDRLNSP